MHSCRRIVVLAGPRAGFGSSSSSSLSFSASSRSCSTRPDLPARYNRRLAASTSSPSVGVALIRHASTGSGKGSSSSNTSTAGSTSGAGGIGSNSSSSSSTGGSTIPKQTHKQRARREWFIVGASGSVAALIAYWYFVQPGKNTTSPQQQQQQQRYFSSGSARTTFTIPIRLVDRATGAMSVTSKLITSLTSEEVDARLTQNEVSTTVEGGSGPCLVTRYDTNSVASNDPIEDKRAEVIVERDNQQGPRGNLSFFAIMDGHAGYHTSTLLSQKLIAFVALELEKVIREAGEYGEIARAKAAMPSKLWRILFGGPDTSAASLPASGLDGDPEIVKRAIGKAFRGLDKEIVNTPVELLKEYELSKSSLLSSNSDSTAAAAAASSSGASSRSLSSLAHSIFPVSPSSSGVDKVATATKRSAYETMLPALSGSCALLTYVDSARGDIYVACTGDSRAVAGWWDATAGRWHVEALSKDQTGRNVEEAKRMRSEHPSSEAEHVIMRGRVLGGLEPTRAFGDARYKWDKSLQDRLYDAFLPPADRASIRGAPRHLLTPPYVTADPVVTWKRLNTEAASSSSSVKAGASSGGKQLKFIVMATDGLWDMMSNEEAVGLVAAHLQGQRGTLTASELQQRCFSSPSIAATATAAVSSPSQPANTASAAAAATAAAKNPQQDHPLTKSKESVYTFQDDNLSTHLVRNALGGGNRERVAGLLAIPAPESRRYRDDITVNVILFDTATSHSALQQDKETLGQDTIKAKL